MAPRPGGGTGCGGTRPPPRPPRRSDSARPRWADGAHRGGVQVSGPGWLPIAVVFAAAAVAAWPSDRVRRRLRPHRAGGGRRHPTISLPALPSWHDLADHPPRRLLALATSVAGGLGWLVGGPVAALVGAVYGALGARALTRAAGNRRQTAARASQLDELSAL